MGSIAPSDITSQPPRDVAIIGGGLSGLTLALFLNKNQIPCIVYEQSQEPADYGGPITLSPNGLRILDKIGIFEKIAAKGHNFEKATFWNEYIEKANEWKFGNKNDYGYDGLRINRSDVLEEMVQKCEEVGVHIQYNKKFSRILEENEYGVSFQFEDNEIAHTALLVGADGMWSKVRTQLFPDSKAIYAKACGVNFIVDKEELRLPRGMDTLIGNITTSHGAFFAMPQSNDGRMISCSRQVAFAERTKEGWKKLAENKDLLISNLTEGIQDMPDVVKSALEQIKKDSITIWPYHIVPRIETWFSSGKRVVLLGDAAHTIPPPGAQGANQAFEDGYTLALVLSKVNASSNLELSLSKWYYARLQRVDKVMQMSVIMLNKRRSMIPALEKQLFSKKAAERLEAACVLNEEFYRWLYLPTELEQDVQGHFAPYDELL